MDVDGAPGAAAGSAWEQGLDETWKAVHEADDGTLDQGDLLSAHRKRMRRLRDTFGSVKRGMIRNLVVVIDTSAAMAGIDFRPRRIDCVISALPGFITDYFSQNPISLLALLETRQSRCTHISDLGGSRQRQLDALRERAARQRLDEKEPRGEASIQNSLMLALNLLSSRPSHASREVLLVYGALNSCDPGDIFDTIRECKAANVRCSVIHLAAAVRVCELLCQETGGTHTVALDETHFSELLLKHCVPPPVVDALEPTLLPMGFPARVTDGDRTPCVCCKPAPNVAGIDKVFSRQGYFCPRCKAKHCELPTECRVCALHLVTAPHVARSYHHLFPVKPFTEVPIPPEGVLCQGCETFMSDQGVGASSDITERVAYQCPDCSGRFCFDCDATIHEVVHNCPTCATASTL